MNKLFFLALFFCPLVSGQDMMRIKMSDGSLQLIPLSSITKITFSDVTAVDAGTQQKIAEVIRSFSLLPNYPNPFNPSTTITYQLPRANHVSVKVYDVTGRFLSQLVDGYQEVGEHRIQWNGMNGNGERMSSGMYVVEVRYEKTVKSRKMLMLK